MQIRELVIGDIPFVADMETKYSGNPWDETSLFTYFLRDDTLLLVADENDAIPDDENFDPQVVGFIGLIFMPPESDILDITVLPEKRNRGIGARLMTELFTRAAQRGVDTTYLEVRVSNAPARHLYQKLGFRETGLRNNYYTDPAEDAITMARRPDQKDESIC
jgi:ribosomal-protein-alanine N-acetyltransferase